MVLHPSDSKQFWSQRFYDYYKNKYQIALRCGPKWICEIGVRWGYSASSFLFANPQAEYTGIDILAGTHGGVKGTDTFGFVRDSLKKNFPDAQIHLIHVNSQQLSFMGRTFDFIHIDGDHSVKGAYHDMCLAFDAVEPGGHLLVDDYNYIAGVQKAAEQFLDDYGHLCESEVIESLRGDLLIKKI